MNPPKDLDEKSDSEFQNKLNTLLVNKPEKPKIEFQDNKDLKARLDLFMPKFTKSTKFLQENPEEAKKLYMDNIDGCENIVEMNVELVDKPSFDQFLSKTESSVEKEISLSLSNIPSDKPNIEIIKPK